MTDVEDEIKGNRLVSHGIVLTENKFLPITVQYYEKTSIAFITLLWRTNGKPDTVIPSS
jgi:hypothetical protein